MTRLSWANPQTFIYETGLDRGVLYKNGLTSYSVDQIPLSSSTPIQSLNITGAGFNKKYRVGALIRGSAKIGTGGTDFTATVTSHVNNVLTFRLEDFSQGGLGRLWTISEVVSVPWVGLISVEEQGAESSTAYYIDGRPFLFLPKPKEYSATLKAYTYPEEFSSVMGNAEAADGMYLDSQQGDSFNLCYRTKVGSATEGEDAGYKLHLIYNATVAPDGIGYSTKADSPNLVEFGWTIQAVPTPVMGYRPTAHITIDSRGVSADKLAKIEASLYGTTTKTAYLPSAQTILDTLSYGDTIVIVDNGDGTWTAEGSYDNIYMIGDGIFQIDNVNTVFNADGTYTVSSTN